MRFAKTFAMLFAVLFVAWIVLYSAITNGIMTELAYLSWPLSLGWGLCLILAIVFFVIHR
jgi:hypothetical protein